MRWDTGRRIYVLKEMTAFADDPLADCFLNGSPKNYAAIKLRSTNITYYTIVDSLIYRSRRSSSLEPLDYQTVRGDFYFQFLFLFISTWLLLFMFEFWAFGSLLQHEKIPATFAVAFCDPNIVISLWPTTSFSGMWTNMKRQKQQSPSSSQPASSGLSHAIHVLSQCCARPVNFPPCTSRK